ncbi:uncharacterized protein BDCG_06635 [Blastomyces dermatitidis ER-3]|uniref:Uncharacterized protein n=3 Tax=Blastomyces TaxID=229219 RepID=A0A179UQE7_BLAGS|nr:uncharacterized protein BDBG_05214 [Blastomyces gilchristii SLH14081]XP_045278038.1 uncharacterized protein BDCG_06635 [Blastomyces dermatitidis ER-3]EEQ91515.2 hypothetical protein BDCG_06635 [Blastomyces dermatitidis ER-3]EGE80407.2 hypothetical protein BDDG_03348 [Blastomyces dermatitidis ATCC 18188]OAT09429.1 hypothetical protein BDBG_05214 [Blastomyces gilchristii SLH14081]
MMDDQVINVAAAATKFRISILRQSLHEMCGVVRPKLDPYSEFQMHSYIKGTVGANQGTGLPGNTATGGIPSRVIQASFDFTTHRKAASKSTQSISEVDCKFFGCMSGAMRASRRK